MTDKENKEKQRKTKKNKEKQRKNKEKQRRTKKNKETHRKTWKTQKKHIKYRSTNIQKTQFRTSCVSKFLADDRLQAWTKQCKSTPRNLIFDLLWGGIGWHDVHTGVFEACV